MDGGIFLCIDYGQDKPISDTFRVNIKTLKFPKMILINILNAGF